MVETDHKPLEMISLKNLISFPVCLQRMLLCLQQYDMVITYQPGKEMLLADVLSCLPSQANNSEIKLDLRVNAISISAFSSSWLTKTANETQKDPILSTVHWLTLNGWPNTRRHVPRIAHNYWDFRDELSIEGDLLMKGERIIIPTMCRDSILADLHKSHEGANRSLSLARTCVCWPGMEADIMDYIKRCVTSINNVKMPVETLHPHEVPTGPWVKLDMDFFQDDSGNKFLIVADYFSKFPFTFPVTLTHHHKTLRYLRDLFSTEGIPTVVMTNNGPPFNGEEFKRLAQELDFKHQTCSPHFHQLNGFIEAMVKKVKTTYKKTDESPNAQARALLQLCDTPLVKDLPSPAEILHGQPTQGAVMPRPHRPVNIQRMCRWLLEIQHMQKEHFDRAHRAKDERVLKVREQVRLFPNKQYGMKLKWLTGTVRETLEWGRSYIIEGPNGKKYRRNQAHLKPIFHNSSSFQDPPKVYRKNLSKSDNADSFQDPRAKTEKECDIRRRPHHFWVNPQQRCKWDVRFYISFITSNSTLFTPFTLIITTRTALIQRETSESHSRGPHCTKASSLHPTSRHRHPTHNWTCSPSSRNFTPCTLQNSMFHKKKSKTSIQHYVVNDFPTKMTPFKTIAVT